MPRRTYVRCRLCGTFPSVIHRAYCQRVRLRIPLVHEDRRGNRLLAYRINRVTGHDAWRVYLKAAAAVAEHIEDILVELGGRKLALHESQTGEWTHRYQISEKPSTLSPTLQLLKEILVVTPRDPVDAVLAIDFYKDLVEGTEGMFWANTYPGRLIYRGKYCHEDAAGSELADVLAEVASGHLLLAEAEAIISVPGHLDDKASFGRRLAAGVAKRLELPLVRARAAHVSRPAAKARDTTAVNLTEEFAVPATVRGRTVIVVDDVYRRGETLASIAQAAKAAGAVSVYGLVGARTRRG